VDPKDPATLLPEEEDVVNKLLLSFQQSEKLKV
jgi:fructose-1,6-bisphosphatase-3